MKSSRKNEGLKALGNKSEYKQDYTPEVLEAFTNQHPENDYWVQFNCPEFTTLCPITGQPDFAEIRIMYIPGERMVESKSLKLYLTSFRNHGGFHEDCVNTIMKDLIKLMDPSCRAAASASIRGLTTAGRAQSMNSSPNNVSPTTNPDTPSFLSFCLLYAKTHVI